MISKTLEQFVKGMSLEGLVIPSSQEDSDQGGNSNLVIQSTQDLWTIGNVHYRDELYTADLSKSLLDSGSGKTQDDWALYSEQARKSNGFYTGDMPLQHSIFTALYSQRTNSQSEEIRKFIQENMRRLGMASLTRIKYQPSGKDKIIHNCKTSDEYSLDENISGPDREIEQSDSLALKALLGTDDIQEIKNVYQWLNNTPTWLWRIEKPSKIEERIAWFDAGSVRVGLYCDWNPVGLFHSFGVRARKI